MQHDVRGQKGGERTCVGAMRTETRPFTTTPNPQNDYCFGCSTSAVPSDFDFTGETQLLKPE